MTVDPRLGRPWIAYVGPFSFPDGGAAARRILGNATALVAVGYEVAILSGQTDHRGCRLRAYGDGIRIASMQERDAEHLPRPIRLARYALMGQRTRQWIERQRTVPDAVILYSGYTPYLLQLTGWCRMRQIPLIFDAVEWYTAESAARFALSPYLWNIEAAMRRLNKRLDGIIAISSFLENYYTRAGMAVARVPPLLDTTTVPPRLQGKRDDRLKIAYTGSPGTKEHLDDMLRAVLRVDPAGARIVMDIAGPNRDEILASAAVAAHRAEGLPGALRVHGRVAHERSLELARTADFSLFLRPRNRVTTAGFPTKFVESLAVGTPVITNLTSDLERYLENGRTGIVCADRTVEGLEAALRRGLEMPSGPHADMRRRSRQTAERHFDCRGHAAILGALVEAALSVAKTRNRGAFHENPRQRD